MEKELRVGGGWEAVGGDRKEQKKGVGRGRCRRGKGIKKGERERSVWGGCSGRSGRGGGDGGKPGKRGGRLYSQG